MSDPTDTLRARVEQAQDLAAAATPGPWRSEGDTMTGGMDYRYVMVPLPVGTSVASGIIARCQRFGAHAHEAAANADLMAAAPDLVGLVTDLWAALEEREADMHARIRQGYDRTVADCWRAKVAEVEQERDEARAEAARLRGEVEAPAVAGGRELVWLGNGDSEWHLCWLGDLVWWRAPYSAWRCGDAESYSGFGASRSAAVPCDDLPAACRQIAEWARADGHTVPPHPLGWDVEVSDG